MNFKEVCREVAFLYLTTDSRWMIGVRVEQAEE